MKTVNTELFNDSRTMSYDLFQTKWRNRFEYVFDSRYRFDQSEWSCNCLKVDDRFFALFRDWREGRQLLGGDKRNRYLCLLERSYLRRILKPDTNADEIFWNLYEEVYGQGMYQNRRVIDNSDKAFNRGDLKGIAERVMEHDLEWIWSHYSEDIELLISYWQKEHPNRIIAQGPDKRGAIREYTFSQVSNNYNWNMTQKENSENLGVSTSYLHQNNFGTREMKEYNETLKRESGISTKSRSQRYRDRKKAGEVLSRISQEEAREMFPEMKGGTVKETKDNYERKGYQVSVHTICKLNRNQKNEKAEPVNNEEMNQENGTASMSGPFTIQTPSFNSFWNEVNGSETSGW